MAQVNPFNFQLNPSSLAQLSNVRPDYMPDVWQWQQNAAQHDQVGLADLMRNAEHEKAMDPGRLAQQQATLESTIASTEGTRLDNQGKVMKNELEQYLLPQKKIQQFQDLILKGNEADEKLAQLEIDKMLRDPDPVVQARGKQLLAVSRKAIEEKRKADIEAANKEKEIRLQNQGRLAEIGAQGKNQERVMQMQIDAGRFKKTDKNTPATFEQIYSKLKKAHEKHGALIDAARVAMQEGNEPLAESYLARAEDLRPQAEAELRMLQKPGDVDLSQKREPGQPIPTVPKGSIAPNTAKPDPLGIR